MLRVHVCVLVATRFIAGAILSALGFAIMQERVLQVPAALTGLVGDLSASFAALAAAGVGRSDR